MFATDWKVNNYFGEVRLFFEIWCDIKWEVVDLLLKIEKGIELHSEQLCDRKSKFTIKIYGYYWQ